MSPSPGGPFADGVWPFPLAAEGSTGLRPSPSSSGAGESPRPSMSLGARSLFGSILMYLLYRPRRFNLRKKKGPFRRATI